MISVKVDLHGLIGVPEASKIIGVAESTVIRAIKKGRLFGRKWTSTYLVSRKAAEAYQRSNRGVRRSKERAASKVT